MLSSSFLFPRVPFKLTPYFCKASGHPKVRVWHFYYLDSVGLSLLPVHVALFVCLVIRHIFIQPLEMRCGVFYKV